MAECDICGQYFSNPFALGPHKKSCWNNHTDVLSDFTQVPTSSDEEVGIITEPVLENSGVPLILEPETSQRGSLLSWLATRQIDDECISNDCETQRLHPHFVYNLVPVCTHEAVTM